MVGIVDIKERIFHVTPGQIQHGDLIWWINEWRTVYECNPYKTNSNMWRLNLDGEPCIVQETLVCRIKVRVVA